MLRRCPVLLALWHCCIYPFPLTHHQTRCFRCSRLRYVLFVFVLSLLLLSLAVSRSHLLFRVTCSTRSTNHVCFALAPLSISAWSCPDLLSARVAVLPYYRHSSVCPLRNHSRKLSLVCNSRFPMVCANERGIQRYVGDCVARSQRKIETERQKAAGALLLALPSASSASP